MGDRLFVDHHTNPQGHYEDMDFLELQRAELVRACGEDLLVTDEFKPSRDFLEAAAELVKKRREQHGDKPWGWKDPRTTLFLPQWRALLPHLRVVALVRDPQEVLNSLCRRMGGYFTIRRKEHLIRTITQYNHKLEVFVEKHPENITVICLERLIAEPGPVLAALAPELGLPLDAEMFRSHYDADAMSRSRRASTWFHRKSFGELRMLHARLRAACL
ncbi:MAG: hypothetical protein FJW35_06710 [Acidobacteria bacterium]|nr:hypothetical protein [Acidobacteriota bacterium]